MYLQNAEIFWLNTINKQHFFSPALPKISAMGENKP
jgi:hypothetical protein